MSYFAAALARRGATWTAEEVDLGEAEDLDAVVDATRSVAGDDTDLLLLLVEEDDEWFGIVRLDDDTDPRVFVSDSRVVDTSALGAVLGDAAVLAPEAVDEDETEGDADDEDEALRLDGEPIGDADVLADLGTPAARLLAMAAEEGQLPADILSALCERAGCLEPLEQLRG